MTRLLVPICRRGQQLNWPKEIKAVGLFAFFHS